MDDILLMEAIEKYLSGQMTPEEKEYFENLRKTTPEVDQMVVEHSMFLQQMDTYAAHRNLKHTIHETHIRLLESGAITENPARDTKARVVMLWQKYKRVTAIAASVAGVIALMISVIVVMVSPAPSNKAVQELSKKVNILERNQAVINKEVQNSKIPAGTPVTSDGSGFLIDAKGYIITNAHVLRGLSNAVVVNNRGQQFRARIIASDDRRDLALLKIDDDEFESPNSLPYGFKRSASDLGEDIFTLGYPRNEITYNEGYVSARTGFDGDTLTYQMSVTANPGNSGGPVLNRNGEVIGVLSTRQTQAVGVVFAVKSRGIFRFIEELKKSDSTLEKIRLSPNSHVKGKERTEQIRRMEEFVFQVKAF